VCKKRAELRQAATAPTAFAVTTLSNAHAPKSRQSTPCIFCSTSTRNLLVFLPRHTLPGQPDGWNNTMRLPEETDNYIFFRQTRSMKLRMSRHFISSSFPRWQKPASPVFCALAVRAALFG
jgi:hypothetical protein